MKMPVKLPCARHRAYQIMISVGTMAAFAIAFIMPNQAIACLVISTATNLIWVWE